MEKKSKWDNKYYLYRHIRLDKHEPFYIGIGSKPESKCIEYFRAYDTRPEQRNNFWSKIVKLNPNYKIEIMLESNDYKLIKEKEKEFIKLYGRRDLKTGTLCNLTDGGEGTLGIIISQKRRDELRVRNKGNKHALGLKRSKEQINFLKNYRAKKVIQLTLNDDFIKIWPSTREAARQLNINNAGISYCARGRQKRSGNFKWKYYADL